MMYRARARPSRKIAAGRWLAPVALLLSPAGCSQVEVRLTSYLAAVEAFPQPGAASLGVVAAGPPDRPLLAPEVAEKLESLLRQRGYDVRPPDESDYLLSAEVGIDAGRTAVREIPVHEPGFTYDRYYYGRGGRRYFVRTYTAGYTRYETQSYTVYTRRLSLTLQRSGGVEAESAASQPAGHGGEVPLAGRVVWSCDAESPGSSSDLRWLVNHMLIAAMDSFGQDTGRQMVVRIDDQDPRVRQLADLK